MVRARERAVVDGDRNGSHASTGLRTRTHAASLVEWSQWTPAFSSKATPHYNSKPQHITDDVPQRITTTIRLQDGRDCFTNQSGLCGISGLKLFAQLRRTTACAHSVYTKQEQRGYTSLWRITVTREPLLRSMTPVPQCYWCGTTHIRLPLCVRTCTGT